MIVSTKPYVLIYNDGTVQNIIKENSGKVYPSANSEYAEFDTESEMNDFIERNKLKNQKRLYAVKLRFTLTYLIT